MAAYTFYNAYVNLNSVDLSDHVKSVTLNLSKDQLDDTCMGDTAHSTLLGLQNNTVSIVFLNDHASAKTEATLWSIWDGGTAVTLRVNPNGSTSSATNPKYTLSVVLPDFTPIAGNVADLAEVQVDFVATTVVTRATSD